jgi:hypothetical protein
MPAPQKTPLTSHRNRMKHQGFVRVEVRVRKEDAALVRTIASVLTDPTQATEARALLRKRFAERPQGLKALLAAAPLEGIDLERSRDTGRAIDL